MITTAVTIKFAIAMVLFLLLGWWSSRPAKTNFWNEVKNVTNIVTVSFVISTAIIFVVGYLGGNW